MSTIATRSLCVAVSEQVFRGAGLGRHLEAGLLEQARDALAKEDRVVGQDDAHPLHQLARVPERREVHRQVRREQLVEGSGVGSPSSSCSPGSFTSFSISATASAERTICPPWLASQMRDARWTSMPT